MKKISIVFALVLITALTSAAQAQTGKASSIKDVDFSNLSYRTAFDGATKQKTIKLAGGKYEEEGLLYELFDQPAYGDLNGDKNEEAVVEIKLSGGSYRAFEVQVFTLQNGSTKMLARLDSDRVLKDYRKYYPKTDLHYAGNNPPTIRNGIIRIEALTEGFFACPKYSAVFSYKFRAGKFILSGKPTRKNFKCGE